MTVLNRGQIAAVVGADIDSGVRQRAASARRSLKRRLWMSLLAGLLFAVGAAELAKPASARGASGGSFGSGISAGHATSHSARSSMGFSGLSTRRFDSRRNAFFAREDVDRFRGFRRFHRRRDEFADGFFPFGSFGDLGWGWPVGQTDLSAGVDGRDAGEDPAPLFQRWVGRYEPPTVETTASGVTIIRGPGSRH